MEGLTRRKTLRLAGLAFGTQILDPTSAQTTRTDEWPLYSYDHTNSGHTPTKGPKRAISEKWTFETDGAVRSSPIVAHGTVYVGSTDGQLYAIDAQRGDQLWKFETNDSVIGSPAVANETVYIGSTDATLYALDVRTGNEQWSVQTNDGITAAPTVRNGTVYIGSDDSRMYAVDAETGDRKWYAETESLVTTTPAVIDGRVYFGSADDRVYAVTASSGDQEWTFETNNGINASPAVVDDVVYISSSDGHLYALNATTGEKHWQFPLAGLAGTSPAIVGDRVIVSEGVSGNRVHALNIANGERIWTGQTGDSVRTSPAIADGVVYVASSDAYVYAIDVENGDLYWRFKTGGPVTSSPAIVGDTVYIGSNDQHVYALTGDGEVASTTSATRTTELSTNAGNRTDDSSFPMFPAVLGAIGLGGVGAWWAYSRKPTDADPDDGTATTSDAQDGSTDTMPNRHEQDSWSENTIGGEAIDASEIEPHVNETRREPESVKSVPDLSLEFDSWTDEKQISESERSIITQATISATDSVRTIAIEKPRLSDTIHVSTMEQLVTEAETWSKIDDHDHIVSVIDYGSEPLPWVAMEFMDAGTLQDQRAQMGLAQQLWTAITITNGMYHAHRRGVSHLQLTAENILFQTVDDAWNVPKIAGWWLRPDSSSAVQSDSRGPLPYTAPEQLTDGDDDADDITDVYRLGAVLYELFTGRPPFEQTATDLKQTILEDSPAPPSEVADLPPVFDDILLTALAKNKTDRYDSVVYLRDAFEDLYTQ